MNESTKSPGVTTFYVETLVRLLQDSAKAVGLSGSDVRKDTEYLTHRATHEGMGFLTRALPKMGKALDLCLAKDYSLSHLAVENLFMEGNFQTDKHGVPTFLSGLWQVIVDRAGEIATPACQKQADAVRALRQITYLLYKLELEPTAEQRDAAVAKFRATEATLVDWDFELLPAETRRALESARLLLFAVLQDFDPLDIVPSHGPGAVATGEKPWQKMHFARFYPELDEEYSYPEYFYFNFSHLCSWMSSLEGLHPSEPWSKLAMVPKDSRGPRLISMEPLELQWIQQGLGKALVKHIERHPITAGLVNFTDQGVNRALALKSSASQECDTLDMEDASDRVTVQLVRYLMPERLWKALRATRSKGTILPSGDRFEFRKFAPMGSALCFPVEALVFWAIAVGALHTVRTLRDAKSRKEVYVYGDDIVLPSGSYERVRPIFDDVHLRFNEGKCCTGRLFRESCGCDAFNGVDVTPTRFKQQWSDSLSPAAALSYVAYHNGLREKGYTLTADFLQGACMKAFGHIPFTDVKDKFQLAFLRRDLGTHEIMGHNLSLFRARYNKRWQRHEIQVPKVSARVFKRGKANWSEMLRLHHTWGSSSPFGGGDEVLTACSHTVPRSVKRGVCWVDSLEFIQNMA